MMLVGWGGNHRKKRQPTAGFMASITCGLTAEDPDQLWTEPYSRFKYGTTFISSESPDGLINKNL